VRHQFLPIVGCAALLLSLSTVPAHAQRGRHHGHRVVRPVIVRSPLLFGSYYSSPYSPYFGFGQWYPPPVFGFPGGYYGGDHFSNLRLQVPQRDALVYVDGYAAGVVDDFDGVFQRLQLIPGHHEIVVYLPGHRTLRQNLYFTPRSTHTIKHTLVPLAAGEAEEAQPVPRAMPPMPGGPPAEAARPAARRSGTLALRIQPGDASVFVDDEPWKGPAGQDRLVIQLSEGSHRVRVEKRGFQTFSVDVDVREGETTSFNVSLMQ
jgi:hypothetical protein